MERKQDRPTGRVGAERAQRARFDGLRPDANRSARIRVGVLCCVVTLLGARPVPTPSADAQVQPPKGENPGQPTNVTVPPDARQEPAPADAQSDAPKEPAPASSEALSARYRFTETYSLNEVEGKRDVITQYRVAVI